MSNEKDPSDIFLDSYIMLQHARGGAINNPSEQISPDEMHHIVDFFELHDMFHYYNPQGVVTIRFLAYLYTLNQLEPDMRLTYDIYTDERKWLYDDFEEKRKIHRSLTYESMWHIYYSTKDAICPPEVSNPENDLVVDDVDYDTSRKKSSRIKITPGNRAQPHHTRL